MQYTLPKQLENKEISEKKRNFLVIYVLRYYDTNAYKYPCLNELFLVQSIMLFT